MRTIDMQTWPRREHFKLYETFGYPHFNMCAEIDLTEFIPYIKQHDISFNITIVYLLTRVANEIAEFRYRIRSGSVVEHEVVHPSTTILIEDSRFSFCTIEYNQDFPTFAERAAQQIASVQANPTVEDEPGKDDLLFMTAIPWVSFSSFMHPLPLVPEDSVPRFAWGKFFQQGSIWKMPLSVQGHHALMDGLHIGRYYQVLQGYLDAPQDILS
jgi:chloramphenicol O-acetyltransferase type A